MKTTQEERLIIEELRNLSKLNTSDVNSFLKSLLLITLLNFAEGDSTVIPYFGELKINYLGDKNTDEGRVADLDVQFIPSSMMKKNIGQLIDVKNPNCNMSITQVDCIKDIMKDISHKLNSLVSKEE